MDGAPDPIALAPERESPWATDLVFGPPGARTTIQASESGLASLGGWPQGLPWSPLALDALCEQLRARGVQRLLVSGQGELARVAEHGAEPIADYRVYGGKPPWLPDAFSTDMRTTTLAQTEADAFDAAYMASAGDSKDPFYRDGARHSLQLLRHWAATDGSGVGHAFWLLEPPAEDPGIVAVGSYRRLDKFTALGQHVGVVPALRGARRAFMVGFDLATKLQIDEITWLICYVAEQNVPSFSYLEAAGHKVHSRFTLYGLDL